VPAADVGAHLAVRRSIAFDRRRGSASRAKARP